MATDTMQPMPVIFQRTPTEASARTPNTNAVLLTQIQLKPVAGVRRIFGVCRLRLIIAGHEIVCLCPVSVHDPSLGPRIVRSGSMMTYAAFGQVDLPALLLRLRNYRQPGQHPGQHDSRQQKWKQSLSKESGPTHHCYFAPFLFL